jgi:hypothetical protein
MVASMLLFHIDSLNLQKFDLVVQTGTLELEMEASSTRSTCGYGNLVEECLGRELYLSLSDCDRHMQP